MGELTQQLIANNKAGLIVYLCLILISNIAFGLFSTKYRFKSYIVYILYALFAAFCIVIAKFYHNFAVLFVSIFLVYIGLYALTSKGNVFKSLFQIVSYLVFFSIFFGLCFLLLPIKGTYGIVIRWVIVTLFYAVFECFVYLYLVPVFKKVETSNNKEWPLLFIGSFLYLVIIFMQVMYPFHLDVNNIGGIILFVVMVAFYVFVFIIIINSLLTTQLYGMEKKKNDELQEIAIKDTLTSLYNKNYLEIYAKELESVDIKSKPSTLVAIMDINKFKAINDEFGHVYGDEVLRNVAIKIKEVFIEDGYKCFRFGGDEFVVIGQNKEINEVADLMTKLKSVLNTDLKISISCGCYFVDFNDIDPFQTAIKNADKSMYQEKFGTK